MDLLFSGMQPTQDAHIGNWLGAIRNWVALQDRYECLFCVVDLHALTMPYEVSAMPNRVLNLAAAYIACGIDPKRSTIFVQSAVPYHTELSWLLACRTPLGDLTRMTQYKDKADQLLDPDKAARDLRDANLARSEPGAMASRRETPLSERLGAKVDAGLLFYPVLMAADILAYRAKVVPVGEDQIQHLELARELARKFNRHYGETFPEPEAIVPPGGEKRILGLDGNAKMSKSRGNSVSIVEEPETIRKLIGRAYTDPQRKLRSDPGRPEVCNVFTLHHYFTSPTRIDTISKECRSAELGCTDCKKELAEGMIRDLAPIRERYMQVRSDEEGLRNILFRGEKRARSIASATLRDVRKKMGLVEGRPGKRRLNK